MHKLYTVIILCPFFFFFILCLFNLQSVRLHHSHDRKRRYFQRALFFTSDNNGTQISKMISASVKSVQVLSEGIFFSSFFCVNKTLINCLFLSQQKLKRIAITSPLLKPRSGPGTRLNISDSFHVSDACLEARLGHVEFCDHFWHRIFRQTPILLFLPTGEFGRSTIFYPFEFFSHINKQSLRHVARATIVHTRR